MKLAQQNLVFFYGFRCNYSCDNCFAGSNSVRTSAYDPDLQTTIESVKVTSKIFDVQGMITLSGGEPFLYWNNTIVPLANEIRKYFPNVKININSNGQLLGKNLDLFLILSKKLGNTSLTVTRHLREVHNHPVKKAWELSIVNVCNHPEVIRLHDDHYHIDGRIDVNIYFTNIDSWKTFYYHLPDGKIKPWKTNDPDGSMRYGCPGSVCTTVYENKLFKCNTLATLGPHLSALNQYNDSDWSKYLNYPFIDLTQIDSDRMQDFNYSYGKPTIFCDMCNNDPERNLSPQDRNYHMVFTKKIRYE